jgi:hypothetical protein
MEVAAGAAIHVDAEDTRMLVEAMDAVASRSTKIAELRVSAIARAAEFSWRRTARRTRGVYNTAMEMFEGRKR